MTATVDDRRRARVPDATPSQDTPVSVREAVARLQKLADFTTVGCTPLDAYGRADDVTFDDLRAVLAALPALNARAERAEDRAKRYSDECNTLQQEVDEAEAKLSEALAEVERLKAVVAEERSRQDGMYPATERVWRQNVQAAEARAQRLQAALEEIERGNFGGCPFDNPGFEMDPATPCPVCGDLGTLKEAEQAVNCHADGASAIARAALSQHAQTQDVGEGR